MTWWNGGAGWASWLIMSVAMVGFWSLVFMAIVALIPGGRRDSSDALRDLDERFARGEINLQDHKVRSASLIDPRHSVVTRRQSLVTRPGSPEAAPNHLKGSTR